jgi:ABC-2 type transport system ATP-binding protein
MILELDALAIGSGPGAPLPPVSAVAEPGRPGVIAVETEQTPMIASLVAGARMAPDTGHLRIDGAEDPDRVRRVVALVDTPSVAEPFPVMTVRRVVREELAFAGHRADREAVATVLDEVGLSDHADTPIERVATAPRVRLLVELALLREGVEGIVVTSPERHGGAVADWFPILQEVADRGITVLVVASAAAAETITSLMQTPGATAEAAPLPTGTTPLVDLDDATQESTRS